MRERERERERGDYEGSSSFLDEDDVGVRVRAFKDGDDFLALVLVECLAQ